MERDWYSNTRWWQGIEDFCREVEEENGIIHEPPKYIWTRPSDYYMRGDAKTVEDAIRMWEPGNAKSHNRVANMWREWAWCENHRSWLPYELGVLLEAEQAVLDDGNTNFHRDPDAYIKRQVQVHGSWDGDVPPHVLPLAQRTTSKRVKV